MNGKIKRGFKTLFREMVVISIRDWIIRGELNPGRGPALEIRHEDKGIALGVDVPLLAVGGETVSRVRCHGAC